MIEKVLFISNLNHNQKSLTALASADSVNITEIYGSCNLPMGVMSMQAYLHANSIGVQSRLVDLNAEFIGTVKGEQMQHGLLAISRDLVGFLRQRIMAGTQGFDAQLIVISCLFDKSVSTLMLLCNVLRELYPNSIVVAGGHPCTNLYSSILTQGCNVDAICLGEGEIALSRLVNSANPQEELRAQDYFVTASKLQQQHATSLAPFVTNLDDIPMYHYDSYFEYYSDEVLTLHSDVLDSDNAFARQAFVMTTRGCPYSCVFCASGQVHGRAVRYNSMQRVKEEIDYWVDRKQVHSLALMDDHVLADVGRAIEIVDYAGSKGLDIRFPNGLAIQPITQEFVDACVRNHVRDVFLALESGSARVLREIIRKPLHLDKARQVLNMFAKTDVFVRLFTVTGFYNETLDDIREGLDFLRQVPFGWAVQSSPTPISGSRLLSDMIDSGLLDRYDYDDISFFAGQYQNPQAAAAMNGNIKYTVNLDVNFVHNPYMRANKYELAKQRFLSVLQNYPRHAFAWFYLGCCQQKLGEDCSQAFAHYCDILNEETFWMQYAKYFAEHDTRLIAVLSKGE